MRKLSVFGAFRFSNFRIRGCVQSAFYEKVPAGGGMCTGWWTKGLLLVENSMTHLLSVVCSVVVE
jgi:hypothetical protein